MGTVINKSVYLQQGTKLQHCTNNGIHLKVQCLAKITPCYARYENISLIFFSLLIIHKNTLLLINRLKTSQSLDEFFKILFAKNL